ncbi:hypothetical protein QX776_14580 [Alteromonadaceae bacterium BrNp21-10]|nr:hypothetical protein [Alteromonadaceae bacterium BrNp21-10]
MICNKLKRRLILLCCWLVVSASSIAQENNAFVVYDDELKNGWVNWSWADVTLSHPAGGATPIKVEGGPWSALAFHHDAFSIESYTKLSFFINGGLEGGQILAVKLIVDGKAVDSNYIIQPKAKSWLIAEVPLAEIAGDNKMVDGIWFQAQAAALKPYYITRIQFE